ncbi:MAG: B12-binding domain-containing radical SAM protein [Bacteroidetes bacterium]|nr:B12-binding domain-containing radical SAM protein [Bacteroidota bacterium]
MHITYIRPNFSDMRSTDAMQPLAFAILYGLTPPDVEILFMDERLAPINFNIQTDLVAISVESFTAARSYQIAGKFRQRGIPVVVGGYHPTFLPDEALRFADAVVIGDAEDVWPQVIEDARLKQLKKIYTNDSQGCLDGIKYDRGIFKGKKYARITPVQFSRGCRFACDFCSIHAFYGRNLRQRPVKEVLAEIEALDTDLIFFVDDNLLGNEERTRELLEGLVSLNVRWSCQVSIDVAKNTELVELMAKSGCIVALIGFESLDTQNLIQMKKKWNIKDGDYATAIKKFYDNGIMIYGTFVFGYDNDTVDSFDPALDFALQQKLFIANFNPLMPTPGSKLYDRLKKEGRLLYDNWWLDPEFKYGKTIFQPKRMTPEQLEEGVFRLKRSFYQYSSIFSRALNFQSNSRNLFNLAIFLQANLVSRREILRKQGTNLGDFNSEIIKTDSHAYHLHQT